MVRSAATPRVSNWLKLVMPGLVPGIHVFAAAKQRKTWMAGTSPAMTKKESFTMAVMIHALPGLAPNAPASASAAMRASS